MKHVSWLMDHVFLWMLFKILGSACVYALQIITQMFHKISSSTGKQHAWLVIWDPWIGKQVSGGCTSSWPETNKHWVFHPEKILQLRPEAASASVLKTKILEKEKKKGENSQHFKIRVVQDALSQEWIVSCFSAPHPPINGGLGWAPNKTIFPLPGTHLRLYCEQRSAAAGTERFEAEIILSAISYKYLTEEGARERRG